MFLKMKSVMDRYGVARNTIYRWIKDCNFPKPIRFGPKSVRWSLDSLVAWEEHHNTDKEE